MKAGTPDQSLGDCDCDCDTLETMMGFLVQGAQSLAKTSLYFEINTGRSSITGPQTVITFYLGVYFPLSGFFKAKLSVSSV